MDRVARGVAPTGVQVWPDPAETERLSAPGAVHGYARRYAQQLGLPVFPVNRKIPYPGTRGFYDATTDLAQIDAWWKRWPDANVAAPTGILYDVLDVDGPEGLNSFTQILARINPADENAAYAELFPTILGEITTPRGFHILTPVGNNRNTQRASGLPGIDVRGLGGYTVLPPSKRDGALAYRWATQPTFRAADA